MIVDSHLHVNFKNLGAREIIAYMDRERIDQCWLLTWDEANPRNSDYTPLPVEGVFEAYEKYPSRIIPMYAPDPTRADAAKRFLEWHGRGIRGCGEVKAALRWDSKDMGPMLSTLNRLGMPLVFHMEQSGPKFRPTTDSALELLFARAMNSVRVGEIPKRILKGLTGACGALKKKREGMRYFFPGYLLDFAALEGRLREYPDIKFIGHGPMFWNGISASADIDSAKVPKGPVTGEGITCRLLSQYGNLYADISAHSGYNALARDRGFARRFLSKYNRKILYGTDNYFLGLKNVLDSLGLPKDAYRRIYGENAAELISHGAPSGGAGPSS
ncbi:MAG: amidohydrolase family protein [Nitrospirota bacterium]